MTPWQGDNGYEKWGNTTELNQIASKPNAPPAPPLPPAESTRKKARELCNETTEYKIPPVDQLFIFSERWGQIGQSVSQTFALLASQQSSLVGIVFFFFVLFSFLSAAWKKTSRFQVRSWKFLLMPVIIYHFLLRWRLEDKLQPFEWTHRVRSGTNANMLTVLTLTKWLNARFQYFRTENMT